VQVDPINPMLKAPEFMRLKLECDEPLSNFAFNFNLRRYNMDADEGEGEGAVEGYAAAEAGAYIRSLLSSI